ncbi:MAG: protease modulator HflK [Clostridia bacterium]|nr:protease modulator HflK [Clostridia bacterium]
MNKRSQKTIAPPRLAALATALCLVACAVGSILLYVKVLYLPVLLVGLMVFLPAVIDLLLLIPLGQKKEKESVAAAEAEQDGEQTEGKRFRAVLDWIKALLRRAVRGVCDLWFDSRAAVMATLTVLLTAGVNVAFWLMVKSAAIPVNLGYHIPVILVVAFIFFIVLEKWCKHAGDAQRRNLSEERTEHDESGTVDLYHQAVLHSLRGALSVGKVALLIVAIALTVKLLGYFDLTKIAVILIGVLFAYETLFLLISLGVRVIRKEMNVAPELSIPMPGLGGEDLGVISYLEKNTGITMRSLWSIRLIKTVLPYSLIGIFLLLWGFSGVVKIEAYQQGAHYRLGKLQEETLQPGLHMTLPWPFDRVEVYDTEVVGNMTIGYASEQRADNIWTESHSGEEYQLLLGGGKELVSINLRIAYQIDDLQAYLKSSASPESLLQAAAYEAVTARTIVTDLETLLATDRAAFAQSFKEELIARIEPYHTGIAVADVVLESIHPPVGIVAEIYQELISAEIRAQKIVLEAQAKANVTVIEAQTSCEYKLASAMIQKQNSEAAARSEVAEFMASVEADQAYRETYRYYKYLQAITEAYSDAKVVIVGDGIDTKNIYIGNVSVTN